MLSSLSLSALSELVYSIVMYWLRLVLLGFLYRWSQGQHLGMPHLPQQTHYCLVSCYAGDILIPNVACYAAPCLPTYLCGEGHKMLPLNDTEREYILHRHNEIRNSISATDMLVMSYNKELEFLASCWANMCMESPKPRYARDACRATNTFSNNGQNVWANASINSSIDWSDIKHLGEAVESWYAQKNDIPEDVIESYKYNEREMYEYYTQVVWADTYLVGCGRTQFTSYKYVGIIIVCDYGPAGNIIGESVYTRGTNACTRYPNMIKNQNYSNICGEQISLQDDHYDPPYKLQAIKSEGDVLLLLFWFFVQFHAN